MEKPTSTEIIEHIRTIMRMFISSTEKIEKIYRYLDGVEGKEG